jgi:hypothetical protein
VRFELTRGVAQSFFDAGGNRPGRFHRSLEPEGALHVPLTWLWRSPISRSYDGSVLAVRIGLE